MIGLKRMNQILNTYNKSNKNKLVWIWEEDGIFHRNQNCEKTENQWKSVKISEIRLKTEISQTEQWRDTQQILDESTTLPSQLNHPYQVIESYQTDEEDLLWTSQELKRLQDKIDTSDECDSHDEFGSQHDESLPVGLQVEIYTNMSTSADQGSNFDATVVRKTSINDWVLLAIMLECHIIMIM